MTSLALVTHLHGRVDVDTARAWEVQLHAAVRATPAGSELRLLVDQRCYEPADLDAHRFVRLVVPCLLAAHGLHPALADAVGVSAIDVPRARGRQVVACALVHHDAFKMAEFNRHVGRPDQQFFSDFAVARRWVMNPGRRASIAASEPSELCCTEPVEATRLRLPRTSTHLMKENGTP